MTHDAREIRRRRKAELAFRVLGTHRGNVKAAASYLVISEHTLRRHISDYCEIHGFETPFEAALAGNLHKSSTVET